MFRFKAFFLFLCIFLFAAVWSVMAQDGGTPVRLGDGYGVTVPDGWQISENSRGYFEIFRSSQVVRLMTPIQFQSASPHEADADAADLVTLYADSQNLHLTIQAAPLAVGDRVGATGGYSGGKIIVVQLADGSFGVIEAVGGVFDVVLDPIILSFDGQLDEAEALDLGAAEPTATPTRLPPLPTATPESEAASSGKGTSGLTGGASVTTGTAATASGDTCTVSVATRDSARLRVGPGENRGVIAFLPVNTDVTVTGRFEADGEVWYQLDKDQAMPGTSANELWVAAAEVNSEGGCQTINAASAPPVIPGGFVAPPTGGDPGAGGAPVVGVVPLAGNWTFSLDPMSDASCLGTENFRLPSVDTWEDASSDSGYMEVLNGGALLYYYDEPFTRVEGTNNYFGTITFDDGSNTQVYLTVISNALLTGQMVGNVNFDGTACSATVRVTLRRG